MRLVIITLLAWVCYAQTNVVQDAQGNVHVPGVYYGAAAAFGPSTIGAGPSKLPLASLATRQIREINDGASATDCTSGGGSTLVVCWSNGVIWQAFSVGGGGGGHNSAPPYPSVQISDGAGGFQVGGCTEADTLHTCIKNPLASTSLTNGALTSGTNWEFNADCALSSNSAVCTHSAGTGYFRQNLNLFTIPAYGNRWYEFSYTTSANTGTPPTCILTSGVFPSDTVVLDISDGDHYVDFLTTPTPVIFTVTCNSTVAGSVTFDDLFLQEFVGGEVQVGGVVTAKLFYQNAIPLGPNSGSADPVCSTIKDIGKQWTDTTSSTTTHFKVCGKVASSPAWVTVF